MSLLSIHVHIGMYKYLSKYKYKYLTKYKYVTKYKYLVIYKYKYLVRYTNTNTWSYKYTNKDTNTWPNTKANTWPNTKANTWPNTKAISSAWSAPLQIGQGEFEARCNVDFSLPLSCGFHILIYGHHKQHHHHHCKNQDNPVHLCEVIHVDIVASLCIP